MATPETIGIIKDTLLGRLGLEPRDIEKGIDPYTWGSHYQRALLWIARGHLTILKPIDTDGQTYMLGYSTFQDCVGNAMRKFEIGDRDSFVRELNALNLRVNSEPPRIRGS